MIIRVLFSIILLLSFIFNWDSLCAQDNMFLTLNPSGHKSIITSVAVSKDKKTVFTSGYDKIIKVWDAESMKLTDEIFGYCGKGLHGTIMAMDISPDNKYLAAAGILAPFDPLVYNPDIGNIRFYDLKTKKLSFLLEGPDNVVTFIAFSKDSKYLIAIPNSIYSDIQIWNIESKELAFSYRTNVKAVCAAFFENMIYLGLENGVIKQIDFHANKEIKSIKQHNDLVADIIISSDGNTIISGSIDFKINIYDKELNIRQSILNSSGVSTLDFSEDQKKFVCGKSMGSDSCTIYKLNSQNQFEFYCGIGGFQDLIRAAAFIGNDTVVLAGGKNHIVLFAAISNPSKIITTIQKSNGVTAYGVGIAESSKNIICFAKEKNAGKGFSTPTHVFDLITHEIKSISELANSRFSIPRTRMGSYSLVYSSGTNIYNYDSVLNLKYYGKAGYLASIPSVTSHKCYSFTCDSVIISGGREGSLKAYNFKGEEVSRFDAHLNDIYGLAVTQSDLCTPIPSENKRLVSCSADQMISIWDLNLVGKQKVIEPIASLYFTDDNEWIIWSPDGYYTASGNGAKYIGYIVNYGKDKDSRFYPFEQFDLKFNRPDIILDRLGIIDPKMKDAYYYAYLKRLKQMGIDTASIQSDLHLPEIEVQKPPAITRIPECAIKISASDSKYTLDRIKLYINGVAVYGINGLSIKPLKTKNYSDTIRFSLSSGNNHIQFSVLNTAGAESLKESFNVFLDVKQLQKTYIITVGISEYQDKQYNLNYAAKDASDMAKTLENRYKVNSEVNSVVILNTDATKQRLSALKKYLCDNTHTDDKVILFMAGHGLLDEKYNFIFANYDIDFMKPGNNGISYTEIESLLDSIPARKKILLIDACHSGEVDKDENYQQEVVSLDENITSRGALQVKYVNPLSQNSSYNTFELMKSLFSDLRKGTGTIVISSAGGTEFALEDDKWKNGVFTYSLLQGLESHDADLNNDGVILVDEIHQYTLQMVRKLTKGAQNPTVRQENTGFDFEF